MKVQKNIYIIFIAIIIQTLLGISVGLTMLYLSSRNHIAENTYAGGVYIGKLNKEDAAGKIDDKYKSRIENSSFNIKVSEHVEFEIKYRDIDAKLDSMATIESAFGSSRSQTLKNLLKSYFSSERKDITPIVQFNEGKLREKLSELATITYKEPVNAEISVIKGKVIKNKEINGSKLNIDNAVEKIRSEIGSSIGGNIAFEEANEYEVETLIPRFTMVDLKDLDEIISQYTTTISNTGNEDSVFLAASAINKVKLLSVQPKKGQKAGTFSFNKYLALVEGLIERNNEGYNQVASTLFAAVLNSGIDIKYITRTPLSKTVDYIKPGLGARVMGSTYDFKFQNSLDNPIMIHTEIEGNELIVSIIGKKKVTDVPSTLETEVVQKFTPSVEYLENQDMKPGEKKLVSSGKEGLKVKVYRVITDSQKDQIRQYLYEDEYKAEKAIVEIGPNTHWGEDTVK